MDDADEAGLGPSRYSIATLIWLSLVAALVANIQPMFLGALAETYLLSGKQVGILGGGEMFGTCLASLSAFYWFSRLPLLPVAFVALLIAVLGNLLSANLPGFEILLAVRFLTGLLGAGVLYALTLGLIGQIDNPDRIIAISILFQVMSLVVGMLSVPVLMAKWGLSGVTTGLALLFATGFLLLRFLPARREVRHAVDEGRRSDSLLPVGFLTALILFSIGLGGVWAFMERIGSAAGFSLVDIGTLLAVAGLLGGAGALTAAVLGNRLGRGVPILVALAIQLAACFLLAARTDWYSYGVAVALFNFSWNLCLPFLMGAIATADKSGRFMVLIPAAQTGGYALGPFMVALFLVDDAYAVAAWISIVIFGLCAVLVVPLLRRLAVLSAT